MKQVKLLFLTVVSILMMFSIPLSISASVKNTSWDGTTVVQPTSMEMVDGVYYYEICSAGELAYIAQAEGDWLKHNYKLMNDIILNDTILTYDDSGNLTVDASALNQWTPIQGFTGIFDGNDYAISGLYVHTDSTAGLFGELSGSVKNLTVENAYVKGETNVGGICGSSYIADKEISNCKFYGAVSGTSCVAGITGTTDGYSDSRIENCVNYGDIWSTEGKSGGIIGYASSYTASVTNCKNKGTIVSFGDDVGGICGSYFWTIDDCINTGKIIGNNNVGGICGDKCVPVRNSINRGEVIGKNNVGGIVGYSSSDSSGYYLYNTGCITGETYVGGICGYGSGRSNESYFTVSEAYNSGEISGDSYVGGLMGYTFNTNISESYSTGNVTGTSNTNVGAFIGYSESVWGRGTISNCYYLKTDIVNPLLSGFGNASDYEGIIRDKKASYFPILSDPASDPGFEYLGYKNGEVDDPINNDQQVTPPVTPPEQEKVWDGTTAVQPTSMKMIDGVYYYEIFSAKELAYIAQAEGDWLKYNYKLMNDIILNDTILTYDDSGNLTVDASALNQWTPIQGFTGIFDGNDYAISGLYVHTDSTAGLFGKLSGSVKNLTVENAYVKGETNVGGICGSSYIADKEISNCKFYGAVSGTSCVAGITGTTDGYSDSRIENCVNYGDIWSTEGKTGGIIGYASSYTASVTNCKNKGAIVSFGDDVGGICGSYFWTIDDCINTGKIIGNNNVGGICGDKCVPVRNSINRGEVIGKNNVGGIVGYSSSDSSGYYLYNTGCITGETYVGGICGYGSGRANESYFTVSEAYNSGEISGDSYVGGLMGYTVNTNISESYSTGNVTGTANTNVGAFIGYSESVWGRGTISNCYYLKTEAINECLVGLGNPVEDVDGIVMAKDLSFFASIPMQPNSFTDVMPATYYYTPVLWAVENEITSGLSSEYFGVGKTCTREQIVTLLWNYAGKPKAEAQTCTFKDVNPEHYYYKAMLWATENGYVAGYNSETFGVGEPCTREQTVMIFWKYASSPEPIGTTCTFKDAKESEYYYKAMLWAVENKVVAGYSDAAFGVGDPCTREQIVTFLHRYDTNL